jgi:hypothetical protein
MHSCTRAFVCKRRRTNLNPMQTCGFCAGFRFRFTVCTGSLLNWKPAQNPTISPRIYRHCVI